MAQNKLTQALGILGATLQDVDRPGTLNQFLIQQQQQEQAARSQQATEELAAQFAPQRGQAIPDFQTGGAPGSGVQAGDPTQRFSQEQLQTLFTAADAGSTVAQGLLKNYLASQAQASPLQQRQIGLKESELKLKEKQINQTVKDCQIRFKTC